MGVAGHSNGRGVAWQLVHRTGCGRALLRGVTRCGKGKGCGGPGNGSSHEALGE